MNDNYIRQNPKAFDPSDFPEMVDELSKLLIGIASIPAYDKVEATISFLRDHRVKTKWADDNRKLIDLIRSGSIQLAHIESLFELCRHNPVFLRDYENYVSKRLDQTI